MPSPRFASCLVSQQPGESKFTHYSSSLEHAYIGEPAKEFGLLSTDLQYQRRGAMLNAIEQQAMYCSRDYFLSVKLFDEFVVACGIVPVLKLVAAFG